MDKSHYDLLGWPGSQAERVLIVSPYVEREFFAEIARRLRPKLMVVVIDDGCRPEDVQMVQKSAIEGTEVRVVLGSARGLSHLKVFYVKWPRVGRREPERTLVWGSGNATQQAFQGDFNAELMCTARLTKALHEEIIDWVTKVAVSSAQVDRKDQRVDGIRSAKIAEGVCIRIPDLLLRSAESKAATFDLWLQRGRIVASYRPDPTFLRVSVTLRKDIPQGATADKIAALVDMPSRRNIGVRYLKDAVLEQIHSGDDTGKRWRSPFCIWTSYGEWCSDSCYEKHKNCFRAAKHEERRGNLDALRTLGRCEIREAARKHYLDTLRGLYDAFGRLDAKTYLHCVRNGSLDEKVYAKLFNECVDRDLALGADKEFCSQYETGCEVSDMPRFRTDPAAWEAFVDSFSRNLAKEARRPTRASGRPRSQSRLVRTLQEVVSDKGVFLTSTKLTEHLRSRWDKPLNGREMTFGEYMDGYQDYS